MQKEMCEAKYHTFNIFMYQFSMQPYKKKTKQAYKNRALLPVLSDIYNSLICNRGTIGKPLGQLDTANAKKVVVSDLIPGLNKIKMESFLAKELL